MTSLGNITPAGLWLGAVQAKSAWLGDKEIWSSEQPVLDAVKSLSQKLDDGQLSGNELKKTAESCDHEVA